MIPGARGVLPMSARRRVAETGCSVRVEADADGSTRSS